MLTAEFCGACRDQVDERCRGSLLSAGVQKVHWECWSHCNLRCDFCYRTMSPPLDTEQASLLLRGIRTGGANTLVFAGGDPTLRVDLPELVHHAKEIGLTPVVHTNMHHTDERMWDAFAQCDHIGVSIDSDSESQHDLLRGRNGNFERVLNALDRCTRTGIRVSVRTVVSALNVHTVHRIAALLERFTCVRSWKLLEFTAVERGWHTRHVHQVSGAQFDDAVDRARVSYSGDALVEMLRTAEKIDAYMMVTSDGHVYGVTEAESIRSGRHAHVGSFLTDHLSTLSRQVSIDPDKHARHLALEERAPTR